MKTRILPLIPLLMAWSCHCQGKMIRNNALMHQMINNFHRENYETEDSITTAGNPVQQIKQENNPETIIALMQGVLCKNFPDVPCRIIKEDPTLYKLIIHSMHKFNNKLKDLRGKVPEPAEPSQTEPDEPTPSGDIEPERVPRINSEELSHFLEVTPTGYFHPKGLNNKHKKSKRNHGRQIMEQIRRVKGPQLNYWSKERGLKQKNYDKETLRTDVYTAGQTKMRKFYPFKKYNKHNIRNPSKLRDHSEEKLSIEVQEKKNPVVKSDSPVWRLDYMKHSVPHVNRYGYEEDMLLGKRTMDANNIIPDENELQASRKDVLHPDLYIKNNFNKKKNSNSHSEGLELE